MLIVFKIDIYDKYVNAQLKQCLTFNTKKKLNKFYNTINLLEMSK